MEIAKDFLKNLITESTSKNKLFKRNLLKEYLQILVLNFIYSHPEYGELIFYGGSCLSHCHGLSRLSEDLDFVDLKKSIDMKDLAKNLENYFKKNTDLQLTAAVRKFRVHLKFPVLHELNLSEKSETDLLFLKVEVFKGFDFCKEFKTEIIPLFKFNKSILVKTFDLSTLMATKIKAILYRKWEKTDKAGNILIAVKGRDYFDLMWYLQKKVKVNMTCIDETASLEELKQKLLNIVEKVDTKSIQLDLEALIDNADFIKNLGRNIKDILKREIIINFI